MFCSQLPKIGVGEATCGSPHIFPPWSHSRGCSCGHEVSIGAKPKTVKHRVVIIVTQMPRQTPRQAPKLTHLDSAGRARMVDVGHKPVTRREAIAEGYISLASSTLKAIADETVPKGEVLGTARIAGILAAKRCGELIPLCHPLPIESVCVEFDLPEMSPEGSERVRLRIAATAAITAKTGVEMEALTAVAVAALTVYDMCKAIDKSMVIDGIRLIGKTGGKSGREEILPQMNTDKKSSI